MDKTYLFSPIGNTDPIKYLRDGSMLHIARVYKPDVVIMYLSKEMLENHEKDNRYAETLKLLGEKLGHTFKVKIISREDLTDVQEYDSFYHEFHDIIADIEQKMDEDDRLLVNMASGTPAMKSALVVMATLAEYRFTPIQVSTPQKKSNSEYEDRDEYDVEMNWELDEDNEEGFTNRCTEVKCGNLITLLKQDMIKKHLLAYDYHAAYEVGKEIGSDIGEDKLALLELADARMKLNLSRVNKIKIKYGYDFLPVKESNKEKMFEYALGLKVKVLREEYADFVRGITPLVVDMFEIIVKKYCGITIKDYCYYDKKNIMKWDQKKLQGTVALKALEDEYGKFKYGPVYSVHLTIIIDSLSSEYSIKEKTRMLRKIEENVRNIAAHDIVSVTEEWVKKQTNKTPEEIMSLIQNLCMMIGIGTKKEQWDSYDAMNQEIINKMGI